jgi:hypothetical protein
MREGTAVVSLGELRTAAAARAAFQPPGCRGMRGRRGGGHTVPQPARERALALAEAKRMDMTTRSRRWRHPHAPGNYAPPHALP